LGDVKIFKSKSFGRKAAKQRRKKGTEAKQIQILENAKGAKAAKEKLFIDFLRVLRALRVEKILKGFLGLSLLLRCFAI